MQKKVMLFAICMIILVVFSSCGTTDSTDKLSEQSNTVADSSLQTDAQTDDVVLKSSYPKGIYQVGVDIPAGTYVVSKGEGAVFTDKEHGENILNILNSGNEDEANKMLNKTAVQRFIAYSDHKVFVSLKEGNTVVITNEEACEFNAYDVNVFNILYSGVYTVGDDIDSGKIDVYCTTEFFEAAIFESYDKYIDFIKENANAELVADSIRILNEYALSVNSIDYEENVSLELKEGMVMSVNCYGSSEYVVDAD